MRERVTRACPSDVWTEEGITFVIFELGDQARPIVGPGTVSAAAVFAVAAITQELIAARVVEGTDDGAVTDLMSEKGEMVP